jgi:hypothetical protein
MQPRINGFHGLCLVLGIAAINAAMRDIKTVLAPEVTVILLISGMILVAHARK